jgi:hypothetical protein
MTINNGGRTKRVADLTAEPGATLPSWYQQIIVSPPSRGWTSYRRLKQLSNNWGRLESHQTLILVSKHGKPLIALTMRLDPAKLEGHPTVADEKVQEGGVP